MRADEKRIDLRPLLTPASDDLSPKGVFSDLKRRLEDEKLDQRRRKLKLRKFASLSEEASRRTAIELNFLMRSTRDTPPSEIAKELKDVARLADELAVAVKALHGISVSVLTGVEDPVSPYLARPRGAAQTTSNRDSEQFNVAFAPELRVLKTIETRELSEAPHLPLDRDREQIDLLDRYDCALVERDARERIFNPSLPWAHRPVSGVGDRYDRWKGSPARQVLLEPFMARVTALGKLAMKGSREFSADRVGRSKLPSLAIVAWEVLYAKICWRCIQDQFGDGVACGLSASTDGDFVQFIRVMAEFASGKPIESGFGGAVKEALAWAGKKRRSRSRLRNLLGRTRIE
jgi:hypothetical protein